MHLRGLCPRHGPLTHKASTGVTLINLSFCHCNARDCAPGPLLHVHTCALCSQWEGPGIRLVLHVFYTCIRTCMCIHLAYLHILHCFSPLSCCGRRSSSVYKASPCGCLLHVHVHVYVCVCVHVCVYNTVSCLGLGSFFYIYICLQWNLSYPVLAYPATSVVKYSKLRILLNALLYHLCKMASSGSTASKKRKRIVLSVEVKLTIVDRLSNCESRAWLVNDYGNGLSIVHVYLSSRQRWKDWR